MKFFSSASAVLALASTVVASPVEVEKRAALQQVTNFGSNPSNTKMYVYVPAKLAAKPAVVVAIHHCQGTGQSYYQSTPYAKLADQKGFVVIYPESPYQGTCWDVSSKSALTHNGGGDSNSIANMVTYALDKYKADPAKVFVTGSSSGAMMTNVMAAAYPELFAAATVYSGVPAGCFVSASNAVAGWNSTCAHGDSKASAQQWAAVAEAMDPGASKAARPRMHIYHGSADTTLYPANYGETIKQWSGVFGYGAATQTQQNTPQAGYTTTTYGDHLVGIYAQGVGHTVPVRGDDEMKFYGL